MNISHKEYKLLTERIDQLALMNMQQAQEIKDLEGTIDYQGKSMNIMADRLEALEEVIEEELG